MIFLILPQVAGLLGSIFTVQAIPGWYDTLVRPEFAPPSAVFAPVWTTLFVLMGIAAILVYRSTLPRMQVWVALGVFFVQLVLNTLWSFFFFGLRNPGAALIEIGFLWMAILATLILFWRISKTAGLLLLPYILWVTFAAYLNYSFFTLNG